MDASDPAAGMVLMSPARGGGNPPWATAVDATDRPTAPSDNQCMIGSRCYECSISVDVSREKCREVENELWLYGGSLIWGEAADLLAYMVVIDQCVVAICEDAAALAVNIGGAFHVACARSIEAYMHGARYQADRSTGRVVTEPVHECQSCSAFCSDRSVLGG